MAVKLETLGRLSVTSREGVTTHLGAQPVRAAVLVYIGVERETTRGALAALLWPDRDESRARHVLSQTLYQLRRDFGDGVIIADREGLRADPRLRVDAVDFTHALESGRMETALGLYRGSFLAGHRLVDTNAFEMWVDAQRARLERMNRRLRRQQIRERVEAGDVGGALAAARDWADLDPLEDEAQHQVIAQLAEAGEIDEALNRYADYARLLERERLSPLDETTALVEAIRARHHIGPAANPPREGAREPAVRKPADAAQAPVAEPDPAEPRPIDHAPEHRHRLGGRRLRVRGAIATAAGVVLVGGAVSVALIRSSRGSHLVSNRVLVAPFDNQTADSTLTPVGQMAADWIAQGLANMGAVQVVPTVQLMGGQMGEPAAPPGSGTAAAFASARAADAALVVSGRYYRRGDSLLVFAQISDAVSGNLLAALDPVRSDIRSPGHAIADLRARVMGTIAARFTTEVPLEPPSVSQPPIYEAFVEFRRGADIFIRGDNAAAIPYLLRAAALDSLFIRPLLLAASAWGNLGDLPRQDSLLHIVEQRADRLAPYERAHAAYIRARLSGDLDTQRSAGRRITELAPGGPAHYVIARQSLWLGHPREALDMFVELVPEPEWMPVWWNTWAYITGAHHALGEHRRELNEIRTVLRRDSRLRMRVLELRALAALGRVSELVKRLDEAADAPADPLIDFGSALAETASELRAHGQRAAGLALLERAKRWLVDRGNTRSQQQEWQLVRVLAATGNLADAATLLLGIRADDPASLAYRGFGGVIAAMRGERTRAIAISDSLAAIDTPYVLGRHTYWRAAIQAHLGETEAALRLLDEARSQGQLIGFLLHADENMEPLWQLPAYRRLIVRED